MSPKKVAKTAAEGFPTADDALEIASEWAPAQLIDSEDIGLRLSRMMTEGLHDGQVASSLAPNPVSPAAHLAAAGLGEAAWNVAAGTAPMLAPMDAEQLRPLVTRLVRAAQRVRKDHRRLSTAERERYNEVLRQLAGKPAYKQLVADHEDMSHRHHTMPGMGPDATQRFLPWHRAYCLKYEELLRTVEPTITIPYWDYANDHARPDWVWKPTGVTRPTPATSGLPTQATIDGLLTRPTYTRFTFGSVTGGVTDGLEVAAHNNVHNWCGGTLRMPMASSRDPIFFLLHANVDRIWDQWQLTHSGGPNVTGVDAGLDPWWTQAAGGLTTEAVKDITVLGYSYQ